VSGAAQTQSRAAPGGAVGVDSGDDGNIGRRKRAQNRQNAGGTWLCRVPAGTSRDSPCGGRGAERAQPGRVVKVGSVILNAFIEPQYTFLSHGAGQPLFQLFSAINVQFQL
jgi:hypothetical protein